MLFVKHLEYNEMTVAEQLYLFIEIYYYNYAWPGYKYKQILKKPESQ